MRTHLTNLRRTSRWGFLLTALLALTACFQSSTPRLDATARLVTRPSRLFKHPAGYILRQLGTLLWAAAYYRTRQLGLWRREHALTAQRKVSAE